jgi:hypothetical protein
MSEFTVEKLPDEPIVLVWLSSSKRLETTDDFEKNRRLFNDLLDSLEEPIYFIYDLSDVKFELSDVVVGANRGAGSPAGSLRHPNVKEVIAVTKSKLINLAARGLKSAVFGNVPVSIFETRDEALAYARTQAAAAK